MIICVVGPTGVGKTKMSVALAKKYNAIIVNCDATQVYKELDIGSAKATKEEQEGIEHYLLDFKNLSFVDMEASSPSNTKNIKTSIIINKNLL